MRIVAVIPARYKSSRFPGKPLADICGKPMIWWVYNQVIKSRKIDAVYVATDDKRIFDVCEKYSLNVIMTDKMHKTSTSRVHEVAEKIKADLYIVINGDEPLIKPEVIEAIIPNKKPDNFYVGNLMTKIDKPSEVVDFTNIKIVTDENMNALFFSRSPIPYPKAALDYDYYKHVGVLIYDIEALRFFCNSEPGKNELIEDVNELRFIDHGKNIHMTYVDSKSLSVDTPKDIEVIRRIVEKNIAMSCGGGTVLL